MVRQDQIREWVQKVIVKPQPDADLMIAIATVESSLNPVAYNERTKAAGLFQLTPICLKDLRERFALPTDPFDPKQAAKSATVYVSWLMKQFPEDLTLVLASWNWRIENVRKWLKGEKELPEETRNFVHRVLSEWEKLKKEKEE
ncbi:lytic transglycosylase domain-containing protein [Kosmotoga pacifica]|uniref:Transglycosylase SLT domain-containing protein n=1 Tax=Kosmotoga pacifica TaxID=1330330 RepID=A0A0G2Z947_9BACT|nr:lytic transglycosylase domain-containing protein [Kosmotoga pacifica]AKI96596.1 hypothetical protein IX53_00780 [Kosmotoga pacifica]